jgi:hypothetical protein
VNQVVEDDRCWRTGQDGKERHIRPRIDCAAHVKRIARPPAYLGLKVAVQHVRRMGLHSGSSVRVRLGLGS